MINYITNLKSKSARELSVVSSIGNKHCIIFKATKIFYICARDKYSNYYIYRDSVLYLAKEDKCSR